MPKYQPSLSERKQQIILSVIEDCMGCGGMSVGNNGFEGSADAAGPTAGYDQPLKKALKKVKRKKRNLTDTPSS